MNRQISSRQQLSASDTSTFLLPGKYSILIVTATGTFTCEVDADLGQIEIHTEGEADDLRWEAFEGDDGQHLRVANH